MAITFKKNNESYGFSLLPLFGVSQSLIEKANELGVTIDSTSPGTFYIKFGDTGFGSVSVKGQAISLAKSGSLGPASKDAVKFQFEAALTKACTFAENFAPKTFPKAPEAKKLETIDFQTVNLNSITDAMSKVISDGMEKAVLDGMKSAIKPAAPVFSNSKADPLSSFAEAVDLAYADSLLQPVKGTSSNSVYRVAALFDGCQVAVRTTANKLSVRVAGPKLSKYKDGLESVGMDMKSDYASCHYSINSSDKPLLKKTLGAIFAVIGFGHLKEVSTLDTLIGGK